MKGIVVLVCFSVLTIPAFAEGISRQSGDKSLNFSFNDFAVEDYKYGIGGKYWLSHVTAMNLSINLGKSEQDSESTSGGPPVTSGSDSKSYSFSVGVEKHFSSKTTLSPYYGGEVFYMHTDSDYSDSSESSSKAWGINALLGAEYPINKGVSLAAEYAYGYYKTKTESSTPITNSTTTGSGYREYSSKLILLLYF